jgi:hypothetical protein
MKEEKDVMAGLVQSKVVSLLPEPYDCVEQGVLNRLEEITNIAKESGAETIAITMTCADGTVVDCWYCNKDVYTLIGAMEALKQRFIDSKVEYGD